jgi:hypothetical protein
MVYEELDEERNDFVNSYKNVAIVMKIIYMDWNPSILIQTIL